jgi:hypothetical protein
MNIVSNDDKINKLNKLYDNLSYFDLYGNSVLLFFILTIFVFTVHLYCIVMKSAKEIKEDWVNQRCNPRVMPFVGFINKPEGMSIAEFTASNFNYCIQDVLISITGYAVQPFTYLTSALTSVLDGIKNSIKVIREFLSNLRNKFSIIAQNMLDRLLNIMIPLQQIFITFKSIVSKTEGILTACLYTSLGTYYTLKSLLGAILQLLVEILIALVIVIAGLWILPFTWPAALTMTSVFLAISIPLAIMVVFMTQVLHIQTDALPHLSQPKVSSCFDKNTLLKMNDGTTKTIEMIKVGDILENNNLVTAKLQLNGKGAQMYNINGVIVSETHTLKHQDKWISVKMYPEKIPIENYNEPYIYCLNTTSKEIIINNKIFIDWDELYDETLVKILNTPISNSVNSEKIRLKENIHKILDTGFKKNTLILKDEKLTPIENIKVGDKISKGNGNGYDIVYGIVHILNKKESNKINNKFSKNISNNFDYTYSEDLELISEDKLFHLLTYSSKFTINDKVIDDYNSLIDLKIYK